MIDPRTENRRQAYLEWLYRRSGRTNGIYTGLYRARLQELINTDMEAAVPSLRERIPLKALSLDSRTRSALSRSGFRWVDEIEGLDEERLLRIRKIGAYSARRIQAALQQLAQSRSFPLPQ